MLIIYNHIYGEKHEHNDAFWHVNSPTVQWTKCVLNQNKMHAVLLWQNDPQLKFYYSIRKPINLTLSDKLHVSSYPQLIKSKRIICKTSNFASVIWTLSEFWHEEWRCSCYLYVIDWQQCSGYRAFKKNRSNVCCLIFPEPMNRFLNHFFHLKTKIHM